MLRLPMLVAGCAMLAGCVTAALGVSSSNTKVEDWELFRIHSSDVVPSDAYAWFVQRAKIHLCSIDRNPLPFGTGYGAYCHGEVLYFFATNEAAVIIACQKPTTRDVCYARFRAIVEDE